MYVINCSYQSILFFFFFQAEDGIRDGHVTGVQTCALPILTGQTAATEGQFEIGTAYMLSKEGQQKQVPTGGSGLHLVRTESQDRQDAAAELFRFLAGPEQSATWHIGKIGRAHV